MNAAEFNSGPAGLRGENRLARRTVVRAIVALVFLLGACAPRPQQPQAIFDDPTVDQIAEGVRFFQSGDYPGAIQRFNDAIRQHPGSPLLAEAQWMLARSYEAGGRREEALQGYVLFLRNFPENNRSEEARLRLNTLRQESVSSRWVVGLRLDLSENGQRGVVERISDFTGRGVNTLVVPAFNDRGVLFPSSLAPMDADLLDKIAAIAHAKGMSVFAEISGKAMAWLVRGHPEWEDWAYLPGEKKLVRSGRPDLLNPEVWRFLAGLLKEIQGSEVDGVLINVSIGREEGWTEAARADFRAAFGLEIAPSVLAGKRAEDYPAVFWRWAGWRARRVARYLGEMKGSLEKFRWGVVVSDDAVRAPREGLVNSAQDLLTLRGLGFDYYLVASPGPEAVGGLEEKLKVLLPTPNQRLLGVASASAINPARLSAWGGVIAMTP